MGLDHGFRWACGAVLHLVLPLPCPSKPMCSRYKKTACPLEAPLTFQLPLSCPGVGKRPWSGEADP